MPLINLAQLEDRSKHEEHETRDGSNYADDMERTPMIAKLAPIARKR